MRWRNSIDHWGLLAILLHWLTALTVFGLFGLGLWMVELDYYHAWYRQGPYWHKSIGVLLFIVMLARLLWRLANPAPAPLPNHQAWERRAASIVHGLLYVLIFTVMVSGYLISSADGRPIEVFTWFELPALIHGLPQQADVAGLVHKILAYSLLGLALLHALAAFKHHLIDRDRTLKRMLGR